MTLSSSALIQQLSRPGGVVELQWSRPNAANAFNEELVEELLNALKRVATEPHLRLLVLSGAGDKFSAGFDLRDDLDDHALAWRFSRVEQVLAIIRDFPAITLASVVGPAFGMGADLVACCDYRLGDPTARFRFPGPQFGVVLGTRQLALRVTNYRAMDILLRNETVDATAALRYGLLTELLEAREHGRFIESLIAGMSGVDDVTLRSLLAILRNNDADASMATLDRSTHRQGLGGRIELYRAKTLARKPMR